jgi:DNA-binding FadR family transcriptional regulator
VPTLTDQPAKTGTLSDQIQRRLLAAIKVGEYAGQTRLPSEAEMAHHFKVSRPVLRQALERLRSAGLIAAKRGSGNYVVDSGETSLGYEPLRSLPEVRKCLEFRCAVEGRIAAAAALHRSAAQLQAIEEAMRAFEEEIAGGENAAEADLSFHLAIARATNNPYFFQTLKALSAHIRFSINLVHSLSTRPSAARLKGVLQEHARVVDAIRIGDSALAERRMTEHLQAGIDRLFASSAEADSGVDK